MKNNIKLNKLCKSLLDIELDLSESCSNCNKVFSDGPILIFD
jgi:hypothetical protein